MSAFLSCLKYRNSIVNIMPITLLWNVYYDIKQEQCQVIFKKYKECLVKKNLDECNKFRKILEKCRNIKNN